MTLPEWESMHGQEARHWHTRLRRSQSQHERGQTTADMHMALVGQFNDWLGETQWLDAWNVSKP